MFVKPVEREEARRAAATRSGLALRVIAERLGVAKSSVSVWTRDIELTEAAARAPAAGESDLQPAAPRAGGATGIRSRGTARGTGARAGARRAEAIRCTCSAACSIWAEGSRSRNSVVFTNSDVAMHRSSCASSATAATSRRADRAERSTATSTTGSRSRRSRRGGSRELRPAASLSARGDRQPPVVGVAVAPQRLCLRHGRLCGATPPSSYRASTARSRSTGASSAPRGSTD